MGGKLKVLLAHYNSENDKALSIYKQREIFFLSCQGLHSTPTCAIHPVPLFHVAHSPVVIVRGGECEDRYKVIALFTGIIFIKPVWLVVCFCFCSDVDVTMLSSLNISRVESVCCEINPEFGMYDGDLSSSSGSDSTGEDDTSR